MKAVADITVMAAKIEAIEKDVENLDSDSINALSDSIVSLTAKIDALDLDKLNASIESIKNLNTNDLNMMVSAVFGSTSIIGTADKLVPGSKLSLESNTVINNKNLTFTCDIPEGGLTDGAVIRVGHGKTSYGGSYIEINKTNVVQYSYGSGPSIVTTNPHSLNIKDYLTVVIDSDYGSASIRIITSTGSYSYSKSWQGRNGDIFAEVEGIEITNVKMRWFCEDYSKPVWMFGDSYFNSTDKSRWTSYLIESGYKNFMMCSYSGMPTERGLTEFKTALTHGTPKYAVWCMGMNNGDSGTTINAKYLAATEEFLEICEEKGITPILSTIPSTPIVLNEPKNAWVRDWAKRTGGRYIDFARAVSDQTYNESLKGKVVANASSASDKTNTTGYQWYDGMLHSDAVHPATTGAYALFMQFLVDFPEIMQENY